MSWKLQRMIILHNDGLSDVEIANALGMRPDKVREQLRGHGIEPIIKRAKRRNNARRNKNKYCSKGEAANINIDDTNILSQAAGYVGAKYDSKHMAYTLRGRFLDTGELITLANKVLKQQGMNQLGKNPAWKV